MKIPQSPYVMHDCCLFTIKIILTSTIEIVAPTIALTKSSILVKRFHHHLLCVMRSKKPE
jgi:hypothetical protein